MGVNVGFPKVLMNELNSFYINEYGYDVRTHLLMYLWNEYLKIKEEQLPPMMKEVPYPTVLKRAGKWVLCIYYPDGSTKELTTDTVEDTFEVLMEWSRYSFQKEYLNTVQKKILQRPLSTKTKLPRNISVTNSGYRLRKKIRGRSYHFGTYSNLEEAEQVLQFLVTKNWDIKYSRSENTNLTTAEYKKWIRNISKE